jgi:citrate lyase subunit beta/citryl-CoA lyase
MRLRAPLFAPADQPRKIEKALASAADAVILDLEDAVAASRKDAARAALAPMLAALAETVRARVIVRVNPADTPWYLADLAAVVAHRPAAVLLPKCRGPEELCTLDHHLEALEAAAGLPRRSVGVLALVTETAASLLSFARYPTNVPRLRALCFGAEDLAADLAITPRDATGAYPAPIAAARAAMLILAGACGVPALDTPFPDPRDPAGFAREAATAAADGFAGKLLIHPAQIEAGQAAFTPSPERLAWARAVAEGFAARPDAGTFALDGRMIDRPHLKLAERILAAAGQA